jgi:hypothetical protein
MQLVDSLPLSHPYKCGWLRRTNFFMQRRVSRRDALMTKKISGDLKALVRRKIKMKNGLSITLVHEITEIPTALSTNKPSFEELFHHTLWVHSLSVGKRS